MRKKILLSAVVFLSVLQLSAQLKKNEIYIGVVGEKEFGTTSSAGVRPSVAIGLSNHSAVGVYFEYTKFKEWSGSNYKINTQIYGAGIFYNYYQYLGKSGKWGLFGRADLSLSQLRSSGTYGGFPAGNEYNVSRFSITPGIFFKPSNNVILHLDLGSVYALHNKYEHFSVKSSLGNQINIGITIGVGNFSRKKSTAKLSY